MPENFAEIEGAKQIDETVVHLNCLPRTSHEILPVARTHRQR